MENRVKLTVAKFGGTSMGSAAAIRKSAEIVHSGKNNIRMVVVSATSGTTDLLIKIHHQPEMGAQNLEVLRSRHLGIIHELKGRGDAIQSLIAELEALLCKIQKGDLIRSSQSLDLFMSYGERLSSHLMVAALAEKDVGATFFDSCRVLITDDTFGKAEPDLTEIEKRTSAILKPLLSKNEIQVAQGFIGATHSGQVTTLGRGGSDYTAALLAEALHADELQIWTDVPGIMTMDPKTEPEARVISEISFSEAAELANFGAKVLHPATIWPAVRKNIQTFIGSTFHPDQGGTRIVKAESGTGMVRAIALRKNQVLITVTSLRMLNAYGFLARLFDILARYRMSVDLVTTSEVSVALTIDLASQGDSTDAGVEYFRKYSKMFDEIREFCEVTVEEGLTLVALVGAHVGAADLRGAVSGVTRLICYGASRHNFCFLVKADQAVEIARRLHSEFITSRKGLTGNVRARNYSASHCHPDSNDQPPISIL